MYCIGCMSNFLDLGSEGSIILILEISHDNVVKLIVLFVVNKNRMSISLISRPLPAIQRFFSCNNIAGSGLGMRISIICDLL